MWATDDDIDESDVAEGPVVLLATPMTGILKVGELLLCQ